MSDGITWEQLQRIVGLEDRVLQLELQLSIALTQIQNHESWQSSVRAAMGLGDANVSLSPEGPPAIGMTGVREIDVPEEPSDDDWLTRLAGLETAPEDDPNPLHLTEQEEYIEDEGLDR